MLYIFYNPVQFISHRNIGQVICQSLVLFFFKVCLHQTIEIMLPALLCQILVIYVLSHRSVQLWPPAPAHCPILVSAYFAREAATIPNSVIPKPICRYFFICKNHVSQASKCCLLKRLRYLVTKHLLYLVGKSKCSPIKISEFSTTS